MNFGNFIVKDQVLTGKVIQKGDSVQDWSLLVGGYSSTCRYSIRYLLVLHEYVLPVFRRVCLESYFGRATPPPPLFPREGYTARMSGINPDTANYYE